MTTYTDIANAVKDEVHATTNDVSDAAMLNLVKATSFELIARGLLMEMSEEPTVATGEAPIAAGMLYFKRMVELSGAGGTWTSIVQPWRYGLYSDAAGVGKIQFKVSLAAPTNIRIEGLGPMTAPAALANTVPEGFEGHVMQGLRVRVLGRISMGQSPLAQDRAEQRREEKVIWEETLNQLAAAQVSRLREGEYQRVPGR